ncbi:MAG: hypothetical protein ACXWUX_09585 [Allosphingosinicella sp.]
MPDDLSKVIADLDAAKASLQRSVRKSRAFIADRRPAPAAPRPEPDDRMFGWPRDGDR